jgi:hypothetical protein
MESVLLFASTTVVNGSFTFLEGIKKTCALHRSSSQVVCVIPPLNF